MLIAHTMRTSAAIGWQTFKSVETDPRFLFPDGKLANLIFINNLILKGLTGIACGIIVVISLIFEFQNCNKTDKKTDYCGIAHPIVRNNLFKIIFGL